MPPYISTRAFIQWLPDQPSEPTSTVVLTSSQRHFVDIRVLADQAVDPAHVEWAFAGRSTSKVVDGKTLSQWHHWIDSKTTKPEEVVDKGSNVSSSLASPVLVSVLVRNEDRNEPNTEGGRRSEPFMLSGGRC